MRLVLPGRDAALARVVSVQRRARGGASRTARRRSACRAPWTRTSPSSASAASSLDAAKRAVRVRGRTGARRACRCWQANGDARPVLEREMERQLNEPFGGRGRVRPAALFRGGQRRLVPPREWPTTTSSPAATRWSRFSRGSPRATTAACRRSARRPSLYPPSYRRLFARNALAFYLGQYLLPGMLLRSRRAFRPRYPHGDSKYNAFTSLELPRRAVRGVVRAPRRRGASR